MACETLFASFGIPGVPSEEEQREKMRKRPSGKGTRLRSLLMALSESNLQPLAAPIDNVMVPLLRRIDRPGLLDLLAVCFHLFFT